MKLKLSVRILAIVLQCTPWWHGRRVPGFGFGWLNSHRWDISRFPCYPSSPYGIAYTMHTTSHNLISPSHQGLLPSNPTISPQYRIDCRIACPGSRSLHMPACQITTSIIPAEVGQSDGISLLKFCKANPVYAYPRTRHIARGTWHVAFEEEAGVRHGRR